MRGTIESIEERKTKKGKPYHLVKIEGEAYWVWEAGLIKNVSRGSFVEFESEGDEYPKITNLTECETGVFPNASPTKKGGYNNNPKSMYISYAKDILVTYISNIADGKDMSLDEIEQAVIDMGLGFYKASENGVVEEAVTPEEEPPPEPDPEEDIPFFEKKAGQSLYDSFYYQLINTKWANKEGLAAWWAAGQKDMLKMTEDERKQIIKTYSSELGKIK